MYNTRDLRKEKYNLERDLEDLKEKVDEATEDYRKELEVDDPGDLDNLYDIMCDAKEELEEWDKEYGPELDELTCLAREMGDDWKEDHELLSEKEFKDHVMGVIEELNIPDWVTIDYETTIEEFQQDYSTVEFNNETYYYLAY